jgi:hypothetical protein
MVWKRFLALTPRGGHSYGVQSAVWRLRWRWYDGVGRCAASGSGPYTWLVSTRTMGLIAFWKYGVRFFWQNSKTILYFPLFLESFVIGFANEFHQLLSQEKKRCAEMSYIMKLKKYHWFLLVKSVYHSQWSHAKILWKQSSTKNTWIKVVRCNNVLLVHKNFCTSVKNMFWTSCLKENVT